MLTVYSISLRAFASDPWSGVLNPTTAFDRGYRVPVAAKDMERAMSAAKVRVAQLVAAEVASDTLLTSSGLVVKRRVPGRIILRNLQFEVLEAVIDVAGVYIDPTSLTAEVGA